jgi:predicted metalloendopeptidase
MSLSDADALAPQVGLSKILKDLVPSDYKLERLIVTSPSYLKELSKALSKTPKDVLHSFFLWKTIQAFHGFVEADAVVPIDRFQNELAGQVRSTISISKLLMLTSTRTLTRSLNAGGDVSGTWTLALAGS